MKETNLIVNGMVCGGCENRVKNAIKNIEGVEKVTADHNTGKVIVISDKAKKDIFQIIIVTILNVII